MYPKLATLFITILFAELTHAQITIKAPSNAVNVTIGKARAALSTIAELYYQVNGSDTTCVLLFQNQKLKGQIDYQSVSFRPENGTLETLYRLFKSVFLAENKGNDYRVAFTLGRESVSINVHRGSFVRMAEFRSDKGLFAVTEKQVDKLFGR